MNTHHYLTLLPYSTAVASCLRNTRKIHFFLATCYQLSRSWTLSIYYATHTTSPPAAVSALQWELQIFHCGIFLIMRDFYHQKGHLVWTSFGRIPCRIYVKYILKIKRLKFNISWLVSYPCEWITIRSFTSATSSSRGRGTDRGRRRDHGVCEIHHPLTSRPQR